MPKLKKEDQPLKRKYYTDQEMSTFNSTIQKIVPLKNYIGIKEELAILKGLGICKVKLRDKCTGKSLSDYDLSVFENKIGEYDEVQLKIRQWHYWIKGMKPRFETTSKSSETIDPEQEALNF